MKPADLQDIVIMQDTTTLAFEGMSEALVMMQDTTTRRGIHPFFMWQDPAICTKDMVANIATILMDETYSITYLKYTN